jgi:hypothetical protein
MSEVTISSLPVANTLSANDRVLVLVNPSTNAVVKTATVSTVQRLSNAIPTSNTANGKQGQLAYNNTHLFVCVANNTWGRVALTLDW